MKRKNIVVCLTKIAAPKAKPKAVAQSQFFRVKDISKLFAIADIFDNILSKIDVFSGLKLNFVLSIFPISHSLFPVP